MRRGLSACTGHRSRSTSHDSRTALPTVPRAPPDLIGTATRRDPPWSMTPPGRDRGIPRRSSGTIWIGHSFGPGRSRADVRRRDLSRGCSSRPGYPDPAARRAPSPPKTRAKPLHVVDEAIRALRGSSLPCAAGAAETELRDHLVEERSGVWRYRYAGRWWRRQRYGEPAVAVRAAASRRSCPRWHTRTSRTTPARRASRCARRVARSVTWTAATVLWDAFDQTFDTIDRFLAGPNSRREQRNRGRPCSNTDGRRGEMAARTASPRGHCARMPASERSGGRRNSRDREHIVERRSLLGFVARDRHGGTT